MGETRLGREIGDEGRGVPDLSADLINFHNFLQSEVSHYRRVFLKRVTEKEPLISVTPLVGKSH